MFPQYMFIKYVTPMQSNKKNKKKSGKKIYNMYKCTYWFTWGVEIDFCLEVWDFLTSLFTNVLGRFLNMGISLDGLFRRTHY